MRALPFIQVNVVAAINGHSLNGFLSHKYWDSTQQNPPSSCTMQFLGRYKGDFQKMFKSDFADTFGKLILMGREILK